MDLILLLLALLLGIFGSHRASSQSLNATGLEKFVDELPQIPVLCAFQEEQSGAMIKPANLTIGMFPTRWKFHRDLPATPVFAYGRSHKEATIPGPTIEARNGIPVEITWENHLPKKHILPLDLTIATAIPRHGGIPTVVHLHGGMNDPASDGHSLAWFTPGFKDRGPAWRAKSSFYRNAQGAANLWYHDHAMGLTRANILAGLSGAYVIRDPALERRMNLPSGKDFDRVLIIADRDFNKDGSIYMNSKGNNPKIHPQWQPEYFGSVILVNGKAWPFLRVAKRKYRFRIINSSNARFYELRLSDHSAGSSSDDDSGSLLTFTQIGSDAFYLPRPIRARRLTIAPSEIQDVIIDFTQARRDKVLLRNTAAFPFPGGDAVDSNNGVVMKFLVAARSSQQLDPSTIPRFLVPIQRLAIEQSSSARQINLYEFVSSSDEPTHLWINALPFDAPATETPRCGSTELWSVINLTEDNHPLHLHLAAFQVIDEARLSSAEDLRRCLLANGNRMNASCNAERFIDRSSPRRRPPRNEAGWKNVYKMKPGYLTRFLVRFAGIDGRPYPFDASAEPGYAYHCHILDHEDNEMMRPLKLR
ncbi:hypothetical protein SELMODRAFT_90700 [Selaginella moellendorffii]|uniref:Plastocyanin-like domain-containing protein n=1 Tax=Selaginella moellendorffii TaxID=88036 RepID=D8RCK1_SELML|nr:multicopper oxidase LPR1 [Selaginella moellendorffii]EFJ29867.1 hypothetical protein SELMODRAFT_90700 [Selaginella moellendorffii]|eukprot:XP_002968751.1 multicopper oxidase LPR1 [Selaginella moellendorffii]